MNQFISIVWLILELKIAKNNVVALCMILFSL